MKEALYYTKLNNSNVQCNLCPHHCEISDGKCGKCMVRINRNGSLFSESYMKVCSMSFDPVEKKPLYHFYPGSKILSLGTVGCNLNCKFCQNFEISQCGVKDYGFLSDTTVDDIIRMADNEPGNSGIAFTYNEPAVGVEFMLEVALAAKRSGIKTAMISNGFINQKPLEKLIDVIDAFNIDLKSFDDSFYRKYTGGNLRVVLDTIISIGRSNSHLEITNLIIPSINDNNMVFEKMVNWIYNNPGKETPLHITGYVPRYKLKLEPTKTGTLMDLYYIATKKLHYVFTGNAYTYPGSNTICPECKSTVIERAGYRIKTEGLSEDGGCRNCGNLIIQSL